MRSAETKTGKANAKLIALAPELLQALQQFVDCTNVNANGKVTIEVQAHICALQCADKLIAKVEEVNKMACPEIKKAKEQGYKFVRKGQWSPPGGWNMGEYDNPNERGFNGEIHRLFDCDDCIYFCIMQKPPGR